MLDMSQVRKTRLDAFLGLLQFFLIERDFWVTAAFVAALPISAGSSLLELLSLWGLDATRTPSIFLASVSDEN
jgi:hypothetical protein